MLIRITSFWETPYLVPQLQIQLRTLRADSAEDGRTDR
jgi:hypothetical protein